MEKITKVVIPAAGIGSRFLPVTMGVPKELLPIGAIPAIEYVLYEAKASGITSVHLVTSPQKPSLIRYFTQKPELLRVDDHTTTLELIKNLKFKEIYQNEPRGLGDAVRVAARAMEGEKAFAVMLPDDILLADQPNLAAMLEIYYKTGKGIVGLVNLPREQVSTYGVVRAEPTMISGRQLYKVNDLVEKPSPQEAPSTLAVVGRYVLPSSILPILNDLKPGKNGELQLTDALVSLARRGDLLGYELQGLRLDVGNPIGMLEANLILALNNHSIDRKWLTQVTERVATLA